MGIVAKRIERVPHSEPPKIVIKSINPEYQTYERDGEEVNIIGRVIWAATHSLVWLFLNLMGEARLYCRGDVFQLTAIASLKPKLGADPLDF